MNAVLTDRAWSPKPAWKSIIKRLRRLLAAATGRQRPPHDWREIEAVLLDYERRKAEISALVRGRVV
ncbi:MAG: hypothetical protein AB7S41_00870 [Parvibaculaceae bacterium]